MLTQTRGAVLSRLPDQASVISTQAVRHYGVDARARYYPAIDRGEKTKFDPCDGFLRCDKVGDTLIERRSSTNIRNLDDMVHLQWRGLEARSEDQVSFPTHPQ